MAGHLYIRSLTPNQLVELVTAGGVMQDTIFHCDIAYAAGSAALVTQENAATQSRHGLPAHCYITFQKNDTSQARLRAINATLALLSKPAGIVSSNKNLANWPGNGANAAADMLWNALQLGSVIVEFYQFNNQEVRDAIPYNGHAGTPSFMKFLTRDLEEVYSLD